MGERDERDMKIEEKMGSVRKLELARGEERDGKLIRQLHLKLAEYADRISEAEKKCTIYTAPEVRASRLADSPYKHRVLGELLVKGFVDFDKLHAELKESDPYFNFSEFKNAFGVIEMYITGREGEIIAGSGLPQIPE